MFAIGEDDYGQCSGCGTGQASKTTPAHIQSMQFQPDFPTVDFKLSTHLESCAVICLWGQV